MKYEYGSQFVHSRVGAGQFFLFWLSEYFYFSAVVLVADMLSNAD